jgi:hypothetical protein
MTDRPARVPNPSEIEITPAMIGAGIAEISGFELLDAWEGYLQKEELVRNIFIQMSKAHCAKE